MIIKVLFYTFSIFTFIVYYAGIAIAINKGDFQRAKNPFLDNVITLRKNKYMNLTSSSLQDDNPLETGRRMEDKARLYPRINPRVHKINLQNLNASETNEDSSKMALMDFLLRTISVPPSPHHFKASPTPYRTKDLMKKTSSYTVREIKKRKKTEAVITTKEVERSVSKLPYRVITGAELLDMANAKGSRIRNKRIRGRLCQRQVLLPEGPKYDATGKMYLVAHFSNKSFTQTRSPRMVLPSCCNCCLKSVLGCE